MYSLNLKEALKNELENNLKLANEVNFYVDDIPASKFQGQKNNVFPFAIIEITKGSIPTKYNQNSSNTRTVLINLGVDTSKEESIEIETLGGAIIEYVLKREYIDDKFALTGENIEVEYGKLDGQGLSPFKYGAITMTFEMPPIFNNNSTQNDMS